MRSLSQSKLQSWVVVFLLLAATFAGYLNIFQCRTFLFDDKGFLYLNQEFQKQYTFKDIYKHSVKPGRPVSNLFLAFAQTYWRNDARAQRIISVIVHALIAITLYFYLKFLTHHFSIMPKSFCIMIPLLFIVHPALVEPIGVVFFRGRVLGTWLILLSLITAHHFWLANKDSAKAFSLLATIFTFLGLATFSNEEFGLFGPLALFFTSLFYTQPQEPFFSKRRLHFFSFLIVSQTIWYLILRQLLKADALSVTPYQSGSSSFDFIPYSQQLFHSGRAILDGIPKILTGLHTSSFPSRIRALPERTYDEFASLLVVLEWCVAGFFLLCSKKWIQVWGGIFFFSLSFYLFFPNVNIGADRYLYFPVLGAIAALVYFLWMLASRLSSKLAEPITWAIATALFVLWSSQLVYRTSSYASDLQFWAWEAYSDPELETAWNNVKVTLLRDEYAYSDLEAIHFVFEATYHRRPSFNCKLTRWIYNELVNNQERAAADFKELEKAMPTKLREDFVSSLRRILVDKEEPPSAVAIERIKRLGRKLTPEFEKNA